MSDAQAREGAAFLQALRQTGNVSIAVKAPGVQVTRKTLEFWRRRFPDFESEWDAAVSFAEAALAQGGVQRPEAAEGAALTQGGEYAVRATRGRRMQVRRSKPGLLTPAGERTFLSHVAATANVALSARATGISVSAIYARRRRSVEFENEVQAALHEGYERLELALLDAALRPFAPDGSEVRDWQVAEPPEPALVTPMNVHEALMVLAQGQTRMGLNGRFDRRPTFRSSRESVTAKLEKALDALDRRKARDAKE